jgi:hypothetical protein
MSGPWENELRPPVWWLRSQYDSQPTGTWTKTLGKGKSLRELNICQRDYINPLLPHPRIFFRSSLNLVRITASALAHFQALLPVSTTQTMDTLQNNSNAWKPTSCITAPTHNNEQYQTSSPGPAYEMQEDLGPAAPAAAAPQSSCSDLPTPATQPHAHLKRERCFFLKCIGMLLLLVLMLVLVIAALIGTVCGILYGYLKLIEWYTSKNNHQSYH